LAAIHETLCREIDIDDRRFRVTTKTFEDVLAEIRRQIEALEAQIQTMEARLDRDAAEVKTRLEARIETLREEEAAAWAALRAKAEAVDDKVRQLEIDVSIAESRLASELAEDAQAFADAVESELRQWDAAIERLQTRVAMKVQAVREQAEAEVAALKRARNRAAERLTALTTSSDDAWRTSKRRVGSALDELERKVREATTKIQGGETHDN
jgi:chromosome segregation ATPase